MGSQPRRIDATTLLLEHHDRLPDFAGRCQIESSRHERARITPDTENPPIVIREGDLRVDAEWRVRDRCPGAGIEAGVRQFTAQGPRSGATARHNKDNRAIITQRERSQMHTVVTKRVELRERVRRSVVDRAPRQSLLAEAVEDENTVVQKAAAAITNRAARIAQTWLRLRSPQPHLPPTWPKCAP